MERDEVRRVLEDPVSQEMIRDCPLMRLGYTGRDGAPRVIPIGFWFTDGCVAFATATNSLKVPALRQDPRVAITIDTWQPLRELLIRATAGVEIVEGVHEPYVEATRPYMARERFAAWAQGVRGLYDEMAVITVTPTWAKLIDFERTLPSAVEELIARRSG